MAPLDIPYFRQDTVYSCGAAVAQMLLRHYGIVRSERVLMEELGTNSEVGTLHSALIEVLTDAGLFCYVNNGSSLTEVARYLADGMPVCVHYIEPSTDDEHYAVVTEVTEHNVILNDPWNGERFRISATEFETRWRSHDREFLCWMAACSLEPFRIGRAYNPD